ncbi:class I SAM-dependent methyltransferase [Rhizobium ruizarguesonis]|uniref:class I SAM-dependent methyltransferase n=1 Tax=Rhizobium ruizarguesonis TaxID=2081791 RepID=UPI00371139A6
MKSLKFTGERFHPELNGEIRQEHMHRYAWCRELAAGKDVIDVASGEGFGSAILAEQAVSVIGVDVSGEAVTHASRRYTRENLTFKQGDAAAVPLPDGSADLVVSFETIEHVSNQESAIAEFSRLLRPDGLLIISSPNVDIYTTKQEYDNPFHTKELNRKDFIDLLKAHFGAVQIFGQRMLVASAILPAEVSTSGVELLVDDGEVRRVTREAPQSMYFIAVAAHSESTLTLRQASILLSEHYDVYWQLKDELTATRKEMERIRGHLDAVLAEFGPLKSEVVKMRTERGLANQLKHLNVIAKSGLFDSKFYGSQSGKVGLWKSQLLKDYVVRGEQAGLAPSSLFDPSFYAASYPDVAESGMGLLMHFIVAGKKEGRLPKAPE